MARELPPAITVATAMWVVFCVMFSAETKAVPPEIIVQVRPATAVAAVLQALHRAAAVAAHPSGDSDN